MLDYVKVKNMRKKRVITYGTFDLLHPGHINILRRAKEMGDELIVGLSTDEFNVLKHKESVLSYEERKLVLESVKYVDRIIPEVSWEQKVRDIQRLGIDIFVMGEDWKGEFDDLARYCEVIYLSRTRGISSTKIKRICSTQYIPNESIAVVNKMICK